MLCRYRIGKKIANGAFGQLRQVKDLQTGEVRQLSETGDNCLLPQDLAIKLEPLNAKIPQVGEEEKKRVT